MNWDELAALRDAIEMLLTWPDAVRDQVARWLSPAASRPKGLDRHPPPIASTGKLLENAPGARTDLEPLSTVERGSTSPPCPVKVKAARRAKPSPGQAAEQKLLAAMRDNPGLSVIALANAAGGSRSAAGERLRQLAARGAIEKDSAGHWRLVGEAARPTSAPSS